MLKLILSSLQLLPLRPLSPLCQVPTLLLTPLMLSLLQMKTRCRRIEKKTAVSCLFILSGTAQSPKRSLIPSSLKLLPILLRLLPQLPVASCPCCQVPLSSMLAMKSPQTTRKSTGGKAPRVPVDMFLTPKESRSPTSTGQEPFISVNELLIHKLPSSILLIIRKYCSLEESRMS